MATYELTMSEKYMKGHWSIKEGVREIMQNAIDAEAKGHKMSFKYNPDTLTLKVHSQGAVLDHSSLLLGETDKANDDSQIGQFGEGYKVGMLALLRSGKQVTIFNRCAITPERWESGLTYSDKYNAKIVIVKTTKINPKSCDSLTFQIKGMTQDEWNECQRVFLDWGSYGSFKTYVTDYGRVLYGADVSGSLFVGGIFIEKVDDLAYGYNFMPGYITLNRDRQTIAGWSIEGATARVWSDLAKKDNDHLVAVEGMLMNNSRDVRGMHDDYYCCEEVAEKLSERFVERHGEEAHPVASAEEAKALAFVNINGVPTGNTYTKILERKLGTAGELANKISKTPTEEVAAHDLDLAESSNLAVALGIIQREAVAPFNVKTVRFHSDDTLGQCLVKEQTILIARHVLSDLKATLTVLVHEYSHIAGGDGEAAFAWAERNLWAAITVRLIEEKKNILL